MVSNLNSKFIVFPLEIYHNREDFVARYRFWLRNKFRVTAFRLNSDDGSTGRIIGILIWLTAVVLRFAWLDKQGLFLDEAWSWDVTRLPITQLLALPQYDPHPVLYYLILKFALYIFPATPFGLRLPSVIFSLITISILMRLSYHFWGNRAALFTGLLATFSSFDIYYAQEARMYSLLAMLVIGSTASLILAIESRQRWFVIWGICAAGMPWVQFYGLFYLIVQVGIVLSYALYQIRYERKSFRSLTYLLLGAGIAVISCLFIVGLYWRYRQGSAGGAWIPTVDDLWMLAGLFSSGLVGARAHFLDAQHLVLPFEESILAHYWVWLGIMVFFAPLVLGVLLSWRKNMDYVEKRRIAILMSIAILPILIAFGYAWGLNIAVWAFKPLLGSALILYFVMGAVSTRFSFRFFVMWVLLCLPLTIASLFPYYQSWQKTTLPEVLETIQPSTHPWAVIVRPAYIAPVIYFYVGVDTPVWTLNAKSDLQDYPSPYTAVFFNSQVDLSCNDEMMSRTSQIWLYGVTPEDLASFPCLQQSMIWVYTDGQWQLR